jgi:hypothetical protein
MAYEKESPGTELVTRSQNSVCVRLIASSLKRPKVSSGVDREAGVIAPPPERHFRNSPRSDEIFCVRVSRRVWGGDA